MSFEGPDRHATGYRREIDGMRAVAVLAVMLYHARIRGFGGGYAGVDIFFVISGYLITGIIVRELDRGDFSLRRFWERRARRILPALFLVLAASIPAAMLVCTPDALAGFGASATAAVAFVANLYFWRHGSSYFGPVAAEIPLQHLWSLSVEEQFYLLFPFFLLLLHRFARRWLFWAVAGAALVSLLICVIMQARNPSVAFYFLPTRAWELLLGASVTLYEIRHGRLALPKRVAGWAALAAAAVTFVPMLLIDDRSAFPWPWAVPTALGTAGLLALATPDNRVGRLLGSRPFVAIGLISYSAYLWHQPLLAFARMASPDALGIAARIGLLGLTLALATLSWHYVERPFRRAGFLSRARVLALAGGCAVLLASFGVVAYFTGGLPQRLTASERALARIGPDIHGRLYDCGARPGACVLGESGPVAIALLGDSHAGILMPAVGDIARALHVRAVVMAKPGCPPVPDYRAISLRYWPCGKYMRESVERVLRDPAIATVIVATRWSHRLRRSYFDDDEGGIERGPSPHSSPEAGDRQFGDRLRGLMRALSRAGKRVILVYPIPDVGWNVPLSHFKRERLGLAPTTPSTPFSRYRERQQLAWRLLDSLGNPPGLERLYPAERLCDGPTPGRCRTMDGDALYYVDDNHLSPAGGRLVLAPLLGRNDLASPPRATAR